MSIQIYVVLCVLHMFLFAGCRGNDNCLEKSCSCCRHGQCTNNGSKHVCNGCIDGYTGDMCDYPCPDSCLNCSQNFLSDRKCFVCKSSYYNEIYKNDKYNYSECNLRCKQGCDVCTSQHDCNKCKIKYYMNTMNTENECKRCPAYCDMCSSDKVCDKCEDGFFWNNHFCQQCKAYCKQCSSQNECSECNPQFYLNGGDCTDCPSGCLSCNSSNYCHACEDRYYLKDNQCEECTENCRRCSISSNKYICQECHQGYYELDGECHNCSKGCVECTSGTVCSECEWQYRLNFGFCYLCPTECTSCSSDNVCTACREGYYSQNGNCLRCLETCTACTTKELCIQCTVGFYGDDCASECPDNCNTCNKSTGRCITCNKAYHVSESQVCIKCPEHCLACDSQSSCLLCVDGFRGNICEDNCTSCAPGTKCDKSNGYCFVDCKDGFSGEICNFKCDSICLSCDRRNPTACNLCALNRFGKFCNEQCSIHCLNGACDDTHGFCLEGCVDGYWGNTCESHCPFHCENNVCDRANGSCTMGCSENYTGSICACLKNCNCDSVDNCTSCKEGYFGNFCEKLCSEGCTTKHCNRTSGDCFAACLAGYEGRLCTKVVKAINEEPKYVNVGLIIGMLFVFVLIALTLIAFTVYKVRKRTCRIFVILQLFRRSADKQRVESDRKSTSDTYTPVPLYENTQHMERQSHGIFTRPTGALQIQIGTPRPHALMNSEWITPNSDIILHEIRIEDSPEVNASPKIDNTYYNTAAVKRRKIKVDTLKTYVTGKSEKSFRDEFKELPDGLIYPYTESQKPDYFKKNRYRGIYPYDKTRVVLHDGMPDYINASFIDGYNMCKAYIACLGPTIQFMGNFSVFWRMVWQEKCGRIVMLTKLRELEVRKCDQYWPDKKGRALYGDIFVTCLEEQNHEYYTVRTLDIQKQGHDNRVVTHFHFTAWPDQGVPENVTSLVRFLQAVNNTSTELNGPTLVHCSAGVGRTGTYIALDMLTKEGETEGHVDIFACVRNLREQRVKMIQTIEQYEYLHHALVYSLQSKHHTLEIAV